MDKIVEFTDEIGLVMLGLTKSVDFENNLRQRLKTEVAETKGIVEEVHDKILRPIQFLLRNLGRRQDLAVDESLGKPTPLAGFTGLYSASQPETPKKPEPFTLPTAKLRPSSATSSAQATTLGGNPTPSPTSTSLIDQKMAGPTSLAKVSIEKTMPPSIPIPRPSDSPKTYSVDPYREQAK
jgi:hypothetical protein